MDRINKTTETTECSKPYSEKGVTDAPNKLLEQEKFKEAVCNRIKKIEWSEKFVEDIDSLKDSLIVLLGFPGLRVVNISSGRGVVVGDILANLAILVLMLFKVVILALGGYFLYYFFPTFVAENNIFWSIMTYVLYFFVTIPLALLLTVLSISFPAVLIFFIKENGFLGLVLFLMVFGICGMTVGLLGLGLYCLIK